jgi:hypothetical protein
LSFVRGDQPFEIDLEGYVVEGEPAIAATAEDFEFRAGPDDVLSSSVTLSGAATGAVPLEVYRLNDGFAYWNARADGGGYLGTVSSGEPLEGIRYFVFLLDLDS